MEKDGSPSHKRYMQGVPLTKRAPGIHRILRETTDLYRSKSVSGLPLESELTSLIEKKKLQEVEAESSEERTRSDAEDRQVGLHKKGDNNQEEDKNRDHGQEAYGSTVDTVEQLEAQTEDLNVEEVLLEPQEVLSTFVEIDLRDEVEEITEYFLTEEKQLEEEEEPAETEYEKHFNLHAKN